MKAIVAKVKVQQGKEADFEKVVLELAQQVETNEPGNQMYKLCRGADNVYYFLELYSSNEAIAEHGSAPHMKESGPKFFSLLDGAPEINVVDVLNG